VAIRALRASESLNNYCQKVLKNAIEQWMTID
jgi:predicted HicB family RNase H-like nuclease